MRHLFKVKVKKDKSQQQQLQVPGLSGIEEEDEEEASAEPEPIIVPATPPRLIVTQEKNGPPSPAQPSPLRTAAQSDKNTELAETKKKLSLLNIMGCACSLFHQCSLATLLHRRKKREAEPKASPGLINRVCCSSHCDDMILLQKAMTWPFALFQHMRAFARSRK